MTGLAGFMVFVGLAFGLVFGGWGLWRRWRVRARIRRRVGGMALTVLPEEREEGAAAGRAIAGGRGLARAGNPLRRALDARYPLAGGVRTAALGLVAGAVVGAFVAAACMFFGLGPFLAATVGVGAGILMYVNVGRGLESRRRTVYEERFLVAIDDFQRMVHFGIGAQQAFTAVAQAAEEPLQHSLRFVARNAELGVELAEATEAEARRVRVGELAMLSAIFATQSRGGGNLSEAVANLAEMLRERLDNRTRLRSMTAESRITLIILALVPVLAITIQSFLQPDLVDVLLGQAGRHLLGIGVGLILGGLLVARVMIARAQR